MGRVVFTEVFSQGGRARRFANTHTRMADKVVVRFRATGDAPILRQSQYRIPRELTMAAVSVLLRHQLGMTDRASLVSCWDG